MRSIIQVFSLAALFLIFGCNVESVSDPTLNFNNQEKSLEECETAFAYNEEGCFIDLGFKRWGWRLGPVSEGFSGSYDLYAGAGQCKLIKGELVGTVEVSYSEGSVTVEYSTVDGKCLSETHLYVGNEEFPTLSNGKPTVAPGQYGNQHEFPDGASSDSYTIDGVSGDIYIIAHAVVCECPEVCETDAGSLTPDADAVCLEDGLATISATPNGDAVVPDGYEVLYVLTSGAELVIQGVNTDPSFDVDAPGVYTIHTLVYDPATLDLSIVEIGVTTGFDVFGLIQDGGGEICASLDVQGAPVKVDECAEECTAFAGTLVGKPFMNCMVDGIATLQAAPQGDMVVPDGYEVIYVLTSGAGLVIEAVNASPVFEVDDTGGYTIHTLVYNPATLDLSIVEFGVTTGFDVFALLIDGGGDICASLDVAGAYLTATECN